MKEYSLGFAFSHDGQHVVLVEKEKPEWQKGLFNGVGGKIDPEDNSPFNGMVREFNEETGVLIEEWFNVCTLYNDDFKVHVFSTFTDDIYTCTSNDYEQIHIVRVDSLDNIKAIYNLKWLIPMAMDSNIINENDNEHYVVYSG